MTEFENIQIAKQIDKIVKEIVMTQRIRFYPILRDVYDSMRKAFGFPESWRLGIEDSIIIEKSLSLKEIDPRFQSSLFAHEILENLYSVAEELGIYYGNGKDDKYNNAMNFFNRGVNKTTVQ